MAIQGKYRSLLVRGLALVGVLVAFTLFINLSWFDEPLHPELVALRTPQPVSMEDNSYPLVYGFAAASDRDPLVAGLAIVRKLRERYENGERMTLSDEELGEILGDAGSDGDWRAAFPSFDCNSRLSMDCADRLIAEVAHADLADPRLGVLLGRYERVLVASRFEENQEFDAYTPLPGYGELIPVGRMRLAMSYAHESTHEFLARAQKDLEFWKGMLRDGQSLIAKMVALAGIRNDAAFLSALLRNRNLSDEEIGALQHILRPLSEEERDIGETFAAETRISLLSEKSLADFLDDKSWLTLVAFQEHATLNEYYFTTMLPMRLRASLTAEEFFRQRGYERQPYNFRAFPPPLYNLGGKLFLKRMGAEFNIQDYITRVHDDDGRISLVLLQAEIARGHGRGVDDIVRSSTIRNPYTREPMDYDPKARTIGFDCLAESSPDICSLSLGDH